MTIIPRRAAFDTHSRRITTIGAALSLAGSGFVTACGGPPDAGAATPAATVVGAENLAVADSGTVESGPSLSGTVAAERQASIRAQLGGTVLEARAELGQRVTRGQLLARLDAQTATTAVASARAAIASARSAAAVATRELTRQQRLLAVEGVAERDVETAQQTSEAAQATLVSARSTLANAEEQAGYARITAPFAGVVSERSVSTGDVVQAGAALYTVIDPTTLRLEASVPSEQLSAVRVGTRVDFTVRGYAGREFTGRVSRVNPAADPATRQVRIYVSVPNTDNALVSGLFASGRVSSERRSGIVVPVSAVDTRTSRSAVARVRGGRVERVNVEVGTRDDRTGQVLVTGIARGDTLLTGAAQTLAAGTAVRITTGERVPTDAAAPATGSAGGSAAGSAAGTAAGSAASPNATPAATPVGASPRADAAGSAAGQRDRQARPALAAL